MSDWKSRATKIDESTNNWKSRAQQVETSTEDPGVLETVAGKLANGASLGFADEIAGGLEAAGQAAGIKGLGGKLKDIGLSGDGPTFDLDKLKQAYIQARDKERLLQDDMSNAHPVISGASELAGSLTTIPATGAATLGGRVAAAAGLGAIAGLGNSQADLTQGDVTGALKDTAIGGALGGALQYGGEKILAPAISKVGDWIADSGPAKAIGKTFAGIPEEYTAEYLAKNGKINARTEEEILNDLASRYDTAEGLFQNARENLSSNKDLLKALRDKAYNELQDYKYSLREGRVDAKEALSDAYTAAKEKLQNSNLMGMKENILNDIDTLKKQVSEGSTKAYNILGKEKGSIDVSHPIELLNKGIDELQINGTPISDTAANSVRNLEALKGRLEALGGNITFPQAKQILQQLDGDINFAAEKGSFAPEADKIKAQIRHALDSILKNTSDGYRNQMQEVAEKTQLLNQLSSGFGSETKVINRLNNLATEKGRQVDAELLNQLGKHTGTDYQSSIKQHLANQDLLNSPTGMQQFKESLPEYKTFQNIEKSYSEALDPQVGRSIDELPSINMAQSRVSEAEQALQNAKDNLDIFKPVSPGRVQNTVRSANGVRDYAPNLNLSKIDEVTGQNFSNEIKNRAILDSFEKPDANGSRKTLLGKALGAAVGGAIGYGETDSKYGAAVGAVAGFSMDKYAGQVFKGILNGQIAATNGIQKIAPYMGKFAQPLLDAASRGNQAVTATHFLLQQSSPEYRQMLEKMNQGKDNGR